MAFNEIFSSFIGNLFKKSEERIRFLSLTESMMKRLPSFFGDDVVKIDLNDNYSPLKPFINILELNKPTDEVIDKAAYSLHRQIFKSYLKNGVSDERDDMLVDEELYYEKNCMRDTIILIMRYLFNSDVIVLNAQCLSQEAIEIIKSLEKTELNGRIVFCFDAIKVESSPKNIVHYFEEVTNQNNFYDISNLEDVEDVEDVVENFSLVVEELPDFDVLYNSMKNNRHFLAVDQNLNLAELLSANIDKFGFTVFQRRAINMELGIAYYFAERNDEATLFFNNVLETQYDDAIYVMALVYLSKTLFRKNANASALKYAILAEQRLVNDKKSAMYTLAKMMNYLITERTNSEESVKKYAEVLKLLKKNNYINNYIKTSLVVPWYAVNSKKHRSSISEKIQEAYELAIQIGNKFVLSTACHWKGIILSCSGNTNEALDWYFRCNELRSEIGDLVSSIKIRNGLSHEALIRAEYDTSYDIINSFIGRLDEIDDYSEILNTMKNISFALFYARHFDQAYDIFQKIIHFIRLFNMEGTAYNSFVPEYNDMLIYKTYIELERGELTRSKINILNIQHNGKAISPIEEPLVKLLEAIIAATERNLLRSQERFAEVEKLFAKVGENQEHRMVFIYFEYAHCLNKIGEDGLSEKYFEKGLRLAEKHNLSFYTQFKKDLTLREYLDERIELEPINANLRHLEEKAEKQKLVNQLHGSLHNYQFLNRIMGFAATTTNTQSFVSSSVQASFDYTMADAIFVFEKTVEGWVKLASLVRDSDITEPAPEYLEKIVAEKDPVKSGKLFFDENIQAYKSNLSKFEFTGCIIIHQSKINPFNAESLNIMNIALSSIQSQLVMFKQSEHLVYISTTDQLSMLKNRRALHEYINLENERLCRYKSKRKFVVQETVAFMDLDNFKYYNDTFGHEAGDLFIVKFAQLLQRVYRRVDFIVRYGGDEFIVVLTDATCLEAKRVGERLYEALKDAKYFIPDLEELLGQKIDIPKKKQINFSMGICSNYDLKETCNLEQVVVNADQALYYSKEHGKGIITIWTDIKDSIPKEKCHHGRTEF